MRQYLSGVFTMVFALAFTNTQAQVITHFAGTGENVGYGGDGAAATAALLYYPSDVALDAIGNLYITDFYNNVVRKVDTFGIIHTVAGTGFGSGTMAGGGYTGDGGQATAAQLNGPFGLILDPAGNIYFADGYNHVVRKVSTSGIITTIAGHNSAAYTGDGGPATDASLNNPVGVARDKIGNLYIADDHNNAVRKVDTAGIITTFAGNHSVGYSGDGGPATAASLSDPIGVGVDTAGNVYIADADNNVIRKVDLSGTITTFAGNHTSGYSGDGGPATLAELASPERVTVDDSNNVYISDFFNNVVRKVNASGTISTFAGIGTGHGTAGMSGAYSGDGGLATAAELYLPQGVAVAKSGLVYICDRANEVIRKVGPGVPDTAVDHTNVSAITPGTSALLVYPNPTNTGGFTVYLASVTTEIAKITITNVLGETMKKIAAITNRPINITAGIPAGTYFLSATTKNGSWNRQLIIE